MNNAKRAEMREALRRDFGRIDKYVLKSIFMEIMKAALDVPSNFEKDYKKEMMRTSESIKCVRSGHSYIASLIHVDMAIAAITSEAMYGIDVINKSVELTDDERYDTIRLVIKEMQDLLIKHIKDRTDDMEKSVVIPYIYEGKKLSEL